MESEISIVNFLFAHHVIETWIKDERYTINFMTKFKNRCEHDKEL